MTTMLDFYREHGISPVTQDIQDLSAHFARRAHLYRSLGLWPKSIEGKSVLEVGPGTGENALYTASLKPSRYVLMEPNDEGRKACEIRFKNHPHIEIGGDTLETYDAGDTVFDVVICEGLLGLCGRDPRRLLQRLMDRVGHGGALVITCIDAISDHAEVLRRALAQRYIKKGASLHDNVEILKPIFTPHLATLKGMTRSVEDWILDNILNPASIGPTFSIPDALTHVEGRFEVLGCSPRFLMDWRWYKEARSGNAWAIESYWKQAHNLRDYRSIRPDRNISENKALMEQCQNIRWKVQAFEGRAVNQYPRDAVEMLKADPSWFGRGQQYLSLVRVQ
jgi:SAM-dependent methyltransferase